MLEPSLQTPTPDALERAVPDAEALPVQGGQTRRHFIRGIAATGATTAAAVALDSAGLTHLLGESAVAAGKPTPFSEFKAIGASSADQVEVPEGFRADILIKWGDAFENTDGTKYTYGFNNDFLAYLPLDGRKDEALLFANHEYPAPFFQHGNKDATTKTPEQIAIEKESVGNAILHIKRDADGIWEVVSPSPYNRRITGDSPSCEITGPLAGTTQTNPAAVGGSAIIETQAAGSLANCSGGITPWGTVLSCEENYSDYDLVTAFGYGWRGAGNEKYNAKNYAHYGWVVEHDPYDPSSTPRKHTALGRFRHENTAFRAVAGKKFVLYMGDDKVDEGVYKFVSSREFLPGRRSHNLRILEEGTLYIAKWAPEGRRRFTKDGDTVPITATSGTGEWVEVLESELVDTAGLLRQRIGTADYNSYFATNRPEDVEVDVDGTVYIAFTNNSGVKDRHGSVRKLIEGGNDPLATTFAWQDYSNGGPTGRPEPGEQGISCADNLVFDQANNLWVVTDISSSSLKGSPNAAPYYDYHGNNAIFMVPRTGPNAGIGFRFANMPVDSEGTGPYFSDDFSTLFVAVQHPGEETPGRPGAVYGDPQTYTSWWPGRQVVTLSGDGGIAMLLGDLLTLRQRKLPVKVVVFNNSALSFVELEMKADGFVNFGTDLDNPSFAEVARAIGLHGVRIDRASELDAGLAEAFAHAGPVVVEVMTARHELSIPPKVTAAQAKGFTLWATRTVLSGGGNEVIEVAKTNRHQLARE